MHIIHKTQHRSEFRDFSRLTVVRTEWLVPSGTQGNLRGSHASVKLSSCGLGGWFIQVLIQMSPIRDEWCLRETVSAGGACNPNTQNPRGGDTMVSCDECTTPPFPEAWGVPWEGKVGGETVCVWVCVCAQGGGEGLGGYIAVLYEVLAAF